MNQYPDRTMRAVERRLEEEESEAAFRLSDIAESDQGNIDALFRHFFTELENLQGSSWSNLPSGTQLSHYLLLGEPPILDLEPLAPQEFEQKHGISISVAECLVKDGRIWANLYVRDPNRWRGHTHMRGLIENSQANGIRVEYCLNALNSQYEKPSDAAGLKAMRSEQFAKALSVASDQLEGVREISRATTHEEIARVVGIQWAYFDVLKPEAAAAVKALIDEGRLTTAMNLMKVLKRPYVSPYTAALAGTCVWGPADGVRIERLSKDGDLPIELLSERQLTNVEQVASQPSAALQLMLQELTGMPCTTLMAQHRVDYLIELQGRDDWNAIKSNISSLLLDITRLAQADQCDLKKLGELRTWLNEQRNMLASYQRKWGIGTSGIGWAAASAAGAAGAAWAARSSGGACLGSVITTTLAAAFGGFVGVPFGNLGEKVGVNLGSWHHSMARPEHHRLIVGLDSLPAKSQLLS